MNLNLREKIGNLFLIGIDGDELNEESINVIKTIQPGFIILFQRNVKTPGQLSELVHQIKKLAGREIVFAIDQEGGIVTRLENGFAISPGAMAIAATGNAENAYITGRILGEEMIKMGISWDLAPVVDINDNFMNPSLGVRSFGDIPEQVSLYSGKFYEGLRDSGVAGSAKHFPGKGSVSVDPHLDMPYLDKNYEQLSENEFVPFADIFNKGIESVMVSHLYLPQIDKDKIPASISSNIMKGILKGKLGYDGILVSDDLTMGGVSNSCPVPEAAYRALMSGMDVIDICHKYENQLSSFEFLLKKAEEDEEVRNAIDKAYDKVNAFIRKFNVPESLMDSESVGSEKNLKEMERISLESITVFEGCDDFIPLDLGENDFVFHVKPLRQSLVEEERDGTYVVSQMKKLFKAASFRQFEAKIDKNNVEDFLNGCVGGKAVVFTENAYLFEGQKYLVKRLCEKFEKVLLVALRNPYDAGIKGVENSILTYGYSLPSQKALLKVLAGEAESGGKCPVKIPGNL